ncbi:MAG: GyrI-like domain-containing protein [Alphaproteobacteria bacterium]
MWSRIAVIGAICAALLLGVYFLVGGGHRSAPAQATHGSEQDIKVSSSEIRIDFGGKPEGPAATLDLGDNGVLGAFNGQIVTLAPRPILFVDGKANVSGGAPATPALQASYAKLRAFMTAHKLKAAGPPIALNEDFDTAKHIWKYRAGIPLAGAPATPPAAGEGVVLAKSYGGTAVRFVHLGDPNQAESTYAKIAQWMQLKSLTASGPSWEEYTSDPQTPVSTWRTNIYVPLG